MKKLLTIILVLSLLAIPLACSNNDAAEESTGTDSGSRFPTGGEQRPETTSPTDAGDFDGEIVIRSIMGGPPYSGSDLEEIEQLDGFISHEMLDEDTMLIKMTPEGQAARVKYLREESAAVIEMIPEYEDNANYIKSIEFDDNFSHFIVEIIETPEHGYGWFTLGLVIYAYQVQVFEGVQFEDVVMIIEYIDSQTGEVLEVFDFQKDVVSSAD